MTSPTGQNINLAALWIPVLPDTSKLSDEMRRAGSDSKRAFEEGFNSFGSSPEALGSSFGAKLQSSIHDKFKGFELPLGMTGAFDKFSAEVDKTSEKLRGQAASALRSYTIEMQKLTVAEQRLADAEKALNERFDITNYREKASATREVEAAHKSAASALEQYSQKSSSANLAMDQGGRGASILAGIMGGTLVLGAGLAVGAVDKLAEGIAEGFEKGIELTEELAKKTLELGETYEGIGIDIHKFTNASSEEFENLENSARQVFSTIDTEGKSVGQTMAEFSTSLGVPGDKLVTLVRHVTDLEGRFKSLKSSDVATIFDDFKVPAEQADSALASLLSNARSSGVDLGVLTQSLAGGTGLVLKEAGMNIGQAAAFMGDMLKYGEPGKQVVTGFSSAMKEFAHENMSFADGMKASAERLKDLGDTEAGQDLAEKLFGTRNWIVAKDSAQQYLDIIAQSPEVFGASSSSLDDFIQQTQTLENRWLGVKHKVEEALMPLGLGAVDLVGNLIDGIKAKFEQNLPEIKRIAKGIGDGFIENLPVIKDFVIGAIGIMGPFFDFVKEGALMFASTIGPLVGLYAKITGDDELTKSMEKFSEAQKKIQNIDFTAISDKTTAMISGIDIPVADMKKKFDEMWDSARGESADQHSPGADIPNLQLNGASGLLPTTSGGAPGGGLGGPAATQNPMAGLDPTSPVGAQTMGKADIARMIYNAVVNSGYSPQTGLAAVAAAQFESSGDPNATNASGHHGLFQESKDKPSGTLQDQLAWFIGALAAAGGPKAVDADPANVIADHVEIGGYSGSKYDLAAAKALLGMERGGKPGSRLITSGSGRGDDVAALLKRGEYVWDTDTMDKWGWLVTAIHQGTRGFDTGGSPSSLNTKGAQVDTIAVAEVAQKLFGISDIGMYRSADGYNEHASGEAADIMVGSKSLGDQVAQYFLQNAAQFGVQYVLWQKAQWNPDGSSTPMEDRGSPTANHMDHVHVRTEGGGFPQGADQSGFAKPSSGTTSSTPAPVVQGMAVDGLRGSGAISGGRNGAAYPGLAGQYGGFGQYGGETADQVYSTNKAVREAQDRASDLDSEIGKQQRRIQDIKDQLAKGDPKANQKGVLGGAITETPEQAQAWADKQKTLNEQLSDATEQLTKTQRERSEQDGEISNAQRKQQEAMYKKPTGTGQSADGKAGESLGQGLLAGIGQELGLGDVLGKSPLDWGIVKLAEGLFNYGNGLGNAVFGKSETPGGAQGLGGGVAQGMLGSLGLKLPSAAISGAPNVIPGTPASGVGFGPLPGPEQPQQVINNDNSIHVSSDVSDRAVMAPVQAQQNSSNSASYQYSGGFAAQ